MLKLINKTRSSSKIGYLVKAVSGGFAYAGVGDTPLGVVTERVPIGAECNIQTSGEAAVYISKSVATGSSLRAPSLSGEIAGQAYGIGSSTNHIVIGTSLSRGIGLTKVALSIGGATTTSTSGGSTVASHFDLTDIGVATHDAIDTHISVAAAHIADVTTNPHNVTATQVLPGQGGQAGEFLYTNGTFASWEPVSFDVTVDGNAATPNTIVAGGAFDFIGDTTYIQIQWNQTNQQLEFSYVGPTDFYEGWDIWVDDVDTTRVVTSGMAVNFISGTYTTISHNFVTGPPPHNDITIDIDQVALDGRYYTQTALDTILTDYATTAWVNSNFDNYQSWGIVDGVFTRDIISSDQVEFLGDTTYIQVQYDGYVGDVHTMQFTWVGPTDFYVGWDTSADTGDTPTRIGSAHTVNFIGGTYLTTDYQFTAGDPPTHDITIDIDQTALDGRYYTQTALDTILLDYATTSWVTSNFDNYVSWDLQTGGVSRENITSGFSLDFIGDTTYIEVQYNTTDDRLEFSYVGPTDFYSGWGIWTNGVDTTRVVTSGGAIDFVDGTYTDVTYTFTAGPAPQHEITIDIDQTALDGRYYTQTTLNTMLLDYATTTWVTNNFDNYGGWDLYIGISNPGVLQETIGSGDKLNFISGDNMSITYDNANNALTFDMDGTFGSMNSWNWEIEGVAHSISNGGTAELIAGTGITIGYTLGGTGEHQATINTDLSAYYTSAQVDAGFYSQTWIDTNIYTITEADAAFDDYGSWDFEYDTVTPQVKAINSGDSFGIVGGTDIGTSWDGVNNRLTINYAGSAGYTGWNWEIETVAHNIGNGGTAELIAGTGISIAYSLGGGGEHQATITSTGGTSDVSVANQANDRVVTATGTTDALNAEGNLTFSGTQLHVSTPSTQIRITDSDDSHGWSLNANAGTFSIYDHTTASSPFRISGTPTQTSLTISSDVVEVATTLKVDYIEELTTDADIRVASNVSVGFDGAATAQLDVRGGSQVAIYASSSSNTYGLFLYVSGSGNAARLAGYSSLGTDERNALRLDLNTAAGGAVGLSYGIVVQLDNAAGALEQAGRLAWEWTDVTATAEESKIVFGVMTSGVYSERMSLDGSGLTLFTGATVDNIETVLTDDDTHLPTSGAVVDYVATYVSNNSDDYGGWDLETGGVFRETIGSSDNVNFVGGDDMQVTYNATGNVLTFDYVGTPGTMDSWNWEIEGVAHSISNGGTAELIAGTGITIGYTLGGGGEHQATINTDLSAYYTSAQVDAGFYSQTWIDTNIYTITEANAAFDDYGGWELWTTTLQETIASGDLVNFVGGTDIQVTYAAASNTLTFAYTGTPGTMSSWNWEIEGVAHSIANNGTAELIAGTGISIAYSLGGGGEHQATITSDITQGVTDVTGGTGIDSTGGNTPDISLDLSELAVATMVTGDWIAFDNAGVSNKALISAINLSLFNNDSNWTSNLGTVTSVGGGTGVSSTGGTTPSIALTVDELAEKTGALVGTDRLVGTSGTTNFAETISQIPLSAFNNDSNWASGTGDMDSWNWEIEGVAHSISNAGTAELIAGTNITISYSLGGGGEHQATINSTAVMTYPGAGIALSTGSAWGTSITNNSANWNTAFGWGNHAGLYDDYSSWDFEYDTVTPQAKAINSGDSFGIVGGTDIGTSWDGVNNRLTINYSGSAGYTGWNLKVDASAQNLIQNAEELVFTAGTGITLNYTVGAGTNEIEIVSSVSSQWTTDTNGITYTGGNVGIGAASSADFSMVVQEASGTIGRVYIRGGTSDSGVDAINSELCLATNDGSVQDADNIGVKLVNVNESANGAYNGLGIYTYNQIGTTAGLTEKVRISYLGILRLLPNSLAELGGTAGNNRLRFENGMDTQSNTVYHRQWAYRDATGTTWTTMRFHDGISVDSSFGTPRTDTKTWYERDPDSGIHYWGNGATQYATLSSTAFTVPANIGYYSQSPLQISSGSTIQWYKLGVLSGTGAKVKIIINGGSGYSSAFVTTTEGYVTIGNADNEYGAWQYTIGDNSSNTCAIEYKDVGTSTSVDVYVKLGTYFIGSVEIVEGQGFVPWATPYTAVADPSGVEATSQMEIQDDVKVTGELEAVTVPTEYGLTASTSSSSAKGGRLRLRNTSTGQLTGATSGGIEWYKADGSTQGAGYVSRIESRAIDAGGTYNLYFETGQDIETPAGNNGTMYLDYLGILHVSSLRSTGEVESYDTSDIRLKNVLGVLNPKEVIDGIMSLNTIRYEQDGKDGLRLGFIAQEVNEVFPENIKRNDDDYLMIHYGKMTVPLMLAVQNHEERILELESEVEELKRKLSKY